MESKADAVEMLSKVSYKIEKRATEDVIIKSSDNTDLFPFDEGEILKLTGQKWPWMPKRTS